MQNPWSALPTATPYVLASDASLLQSFNARAASKHQFDMLLFPEPFFGSLSATVVVLNLNPGWSPDDASVHAQTEFAAMSRSSLAHELKPYPFLHLQPTGSTPGGAWWFQRVRELVGEVGFESVARGLACIQFTPYHSREYSSASPRLPSQEYSFYLVRRAMARGAEIVVMRSVNLWLSAVPELASYARLHRGTKPRAPFISPGNLKSAYQAVAERLRSAA
ncbi:hypothetical protein KBY93_15510 [Synechococcus sp. J7-Johnson]|uniref:hypothetical protein n=1 Tax=Synechococcus sp. J7-Johnson TaxID=2823737 RepID=UPI0020CCDBD3|nr:hypothetical protein [Synechococcus sp. J7-Johnson]MCP9842013.1 hypothetical protein [Synechococcus sp. J7-Johnson]